MNVILVQNLTYFMSMSATGLMNQQWGKIYVQVWNSVYKKIDITSPFYVLTTFG